MPIVIAAICQENGAAVVAKQFFDMRQMRLEQLLRLFAQKRESGKQNTLVETDKMRFLYTPMEGRLYLVLVTTLESSIHEDSETLNLLFEFIKMECEAQLTKEKKHTRAFVLGAIEQTQPATFLQKIQNAAFEILFGFEEAVLAGEKQVSGIRELSEIVKMESHDEQIQNAVQQDKMKEAKEHAKKKHKQMAEARKGGHGIARQEETGEERQTGRAARTEEPQRARPQTKTLKLGRRKPREKREDEATQMPIEITVKEKITAVLERDGALQSMQTEGALYLCCRSAETSQIQLHTDHNAAMAFLPHANIDSELFAKESLVSLRNKASSFPLQKQLCVLQWTEEMVDAEDIPLRLVCWPSATENAEGTRCDLSIDYTLSNSAMRLSEVCISIPAPAELQPCIVKGAAEMVDGCCLWKIPSINASNPTGTLEISAETASANIFFPVSVSFSGDSFVSHFNVLRCSLAKTDASVPMTWHRSTHTEKYTVE